MSAKILNFPDHRGAAMTADEQREILLAAHAALIEAITEHQTDDGSVPVVFTLDEAMELCEVVEKAMGPEEFDVSID